IDRIETMARQELLALTKCRQADVRPISGNNANAAIALGYLRGGDPIIVNSTAAGGHISHNTVGVFGRRIQNRGMSLSLDAPKHIPLHFFPIAEDLYHLDVPKSIDPIEEVKPRLIVLGKSIFLFPDPASVLGRALDDEGIAVEARGFGYTASHQIAVNVAAHGGGVEVAQRLEANDVIVNYNLLPLDTDPRRPSGLRIGVQEMTRYGMKEAD